MDQKLWAKQDWNFSVFGTKQKNTTIANGLRGSPRLAAGLCAAGVMSKRPKLNENSLANKLSE